MSSSKHSNNSKSIRARAIEIGIPKDARIIKEKRGDSNSVAGLIGNGISRQAIFDLTDEQITKLCPSKLEREMILDYKHKYSPEFAIDTPTIEEKQVTEATPVSNTEVVEQTNPTVIRKSQQNPIDYMIAWQPVLIPKSVLQPFIGAASPVQLLN